MTLMHVDHRTGRFRHPRCGRWARVYRRVLVGVGGGLLSSLLLGGSTGALAQARISAEVLGAETLNAEHRQSITTFLRENSDMLMSEDPKQVSRARGAVVDVFGRWGNGSGTQAFIDYYNEQLAGVLTSTLQPDARLLSRVNAAILASRVLSPAVVPVFATGLADDNEGVRFQVATSIGVLADRDAQLAPEDRLAETVWAELLSLSGERLKEETSPLVVQRLLVGMGKLPIAAAAIQVLEAIDGRVVLHVDNREQPMTAELEALKQVVLYINSQPEEQRPDLFKQAMGVSLKLAKVAADQLQRPMSDQLQAQRSDLIRYVEAYVLRDPASNTFGVSQNRIPVAPDKINSDLRAGRYADVQRSLVAWEELLLDSPIGLDPTLVRVPS